MGKEATTYRIEVSKHSSLKYFYSSSFIFLVLSTIWSWPYYLPTMFKVALAAVAIAVFLRGICLTRRTQITRVISINTAGRLVCYGEKATAGWLLNTSRGFLGFYALDYCRELDNKSTTLVIFSDQLTNIDNRRLSRVINKLKFIS